jgi:hypothetical protein
LKNRPILFDACINNPYGVTIQRRINQPFGMGSKKYNAETTTAVNKANHHC